MNESIRRWSGLSLLGLWLVGAVNALYAQDACLDARVTAFDAGVFQSFGFSVALSGDTALVGAEWDNDNGTQSGSVYVYQREPGPEGSWVFIQKLLASDGTTNNRFGSAVTIDGDVIVVGAFGHFHDGDSGSGSAYLFRFDKDSSMWIEKQELLASDGVAGDKFGSSVAISGNVVLIGAADNDHDGGTNAGAAYIYRFNPETLQWIEVQKLTASDAMNFDGFGLSVSLAGDLALIGTPGQDGAQEETGAAYVFRFDPDTATWVEQAKVFASDGAAHDSFGWSVGVSENVALAGALGAKSDAGAAYVFRFDPKSSAWFEEQTLLPSGGAPEQFGRAVAIDGDTALIGSPFADAVGDSYGAAYVFRYDGDTSQWSQDDMLVPDPGPWTAFFGWSVALDGDRAVCGAHGEDQQRGAAYIYNVAPNCNCPHDLDADGDVGVKDLLILLGSWGACPPTGDCPADFDNTGDVGVKDLLSLLGAWGQCP